VRQNKQKLRGKQNTTEKYQQNTQVSCITNEVQKCDKYAQKTTC
jgi:hypothetical protein